MIITVHYFLESRDLLSFETGEMGAIESWQTGCAVFETEFDGDLQDLKRNFYFVEGDEPYEKLVRKSDEEIEELARPTLMEIQSAVYAELMRTDGYVDPPSDRPRVGPLRYDWRPYRQQLRDASKAENLSAFVDALPTWPDEKKTDPFAELRARMRG